MCHIGKQELNRGIVTLLKVGAQATKIIFGHFDLEKWRGLYLLLLESEPKTGGGPAHSKTTYALAYTANFDKPRKSSAFEQGILRFLKICC